MVVFDSEYVCTRCKRRIKKGHEVWIYDLPYGSGCARIVRAADKYLPRQTAKGVPFDIDFECFRTTGGNELGEEE